MCDLESISAATEGAGAVVHAAAAGMMGTANLPAFDDVTERVNVGGTRNVVKACLGNRVRALGKYEFEDLRKTKAVANACALNEHDVLLNVFMVH